MPYCGYKGRGRDKVDILEISAIGSWFFYYYKVFRFAGSYLQPHTAVELRHMQRLPVESTKSHDLDWAFRRMCVCM